MADIMAVCGIVWIRNSSLPLKQNTSDPKARSDLFVKTWEFLICHHSVHVNVIIAFFVLNKLRLFVQVHHPSFDTE
jgi:hypothetical protein